MKNSSKKIFANYSLHIIVIALLLTAVLIGVVFLERPAIVQAASNKQYISEVRVFDPSLGSYDSEAKKLTDEGYKIDKASNLLKGYDGQEMYLAYKTTLDPKNAITDFSLMNMKGPYSFAGYEDLLEDVKMYADERIALMVSGIEEFRKNYKADAPSAKYAYEMMNKYREDDSNTLIGDFLLKTPLTNTPGVPENALRNMVMQAEPVILSVIDKSLAIGSAPINEEKNWIEKLSELSAVEIGDAKGVPTLDSKAKKIKAAIEPIAEKLVNYHEFYQVVFKEFSATSEAELKKMMEDPVIKQKFDDLVISYHGKDEIGDFDSISMMYLMLASFKYENDEDLGFEGKMSLVIPSEIQNGSVLDLIMRVKDEENLSFEDLYPMASILSDAQVNMMYLAGLETSIMLCDNNQEVWNKTAIEMKDAEIADKKIADFPVISVYAGVDRTLYNPDGIALSDEAARRQFVDTADTWYANNLDQTTEWILRGVLGASAVAFVGMSIRLGIKVFKRAFQPSMISAADIGTTGMNISRYYDDLLEDILNMSDDSVAREAYQLANKASKVKDVALSQKWSVNGLSNSLKYAFGVVMFVFIVALTVYLVLELTEYYKDPVYTEKPRIIFHNFVNDAGKSVYVRYDAVTNQNKEMCDVRNRNSKQWVLLYTSKDKNAGNPILADSIKVSYSKSENSAGYLPVHRIGENDVYNIQDGKTCTLYFKQDSNAFPSMGSTFSAGAFTIALCGGILGGAALGFLATWLIMKKKRKSTELLVEDKK